ncbi:MAG: NlpC/P60 family protein [Negativicutes bacterium]|nr:NlpC/P60 family protein [Negativicutes bacterium]
MKKGLLIALSCICALLFVTPVMAASAPAGQLLKQGVTGDEVYKLQQKLQEFGYYQDSPDGIFGNDTKQAVVSFQMDAGLQPDGIVGSATLAAIKQFKPGSLPVSRGLNDSRKAQQLVIFAKQFIGVPYVWAGRSPAGFDCSGFISYVFDHFGVALPRMADEQFESGLAVNRRDLQVGDLVFFSTYEPGPSHVGIYIGSGQFIHASSGANEVTITPMAKQYYVERYLGARRVLR